MAQEHEIRQRWESQRLYVTVAFAILIIAAISSTASQHSPIWLFFVLTGLGVLVLVGDKVRLWMALRHVRRSHSEEERNQE